MDNMEKFLWGFMIFFILCIVLLFVGFYYEYKQADASEFVTIKQIDILPENKLVKIKITIGDTIKQWKTCAKTCTYYYIYIISDNTGSTLAQSNSKLTGNITIYGFIKILDNNIRYIRVDGTI